MGYWLNNRVENSPLSFRRLERAMFRFRQMRSLQNSRPSMQIFTTFSPWSATSSIVRFTKIDALPLWQNGGFLQARPPPFQPEHIQSRAVRIGPTSTALAFTLTASAQDAKGFGTTRRCITQQAKIRIEYGRQNVSDVIFPVRSRGQMYICGNIDRRVIHAVAGHRVWPTCN